LLFNTGYGEQALGNFEKANNLYIQAAKNSISLSGLAKHLPPTNESPTLYFLAIVNRIHNN